MFLSDNETQCRHKQIVLLRVIYFIYTIYIYTSWIGNTHNIIGPMLGNLHHGLYISIMLKVTNANWLMTGRYNVYHVNHLCVQLNMWLILVFWSGTKLPVILQIWPDHGAGYKTLKGSSNCTQMYLQSYWQSIKQHFHLTTKMSWQVFHHFKENADNSECCATSSAMCCYRYALHSLHMHTNAKRNTCSLLDTSLE